MLQSCGTSLGATNDVSSVVFAELELLLLWKDKYLLCWSQCSKFFLCVNFVTYGLTVSFIIICEMIYYFHVLMQ